MGLVLLVLAFLGGVMTGGADLGGAPEVHAHDEGAAWTCSMHPQIVQDQPGECPICGMDLVRTVGADRGAPPTSVALSNRARVLSELRTMPVQRLRGTAGELRLLGRVEPDESTRRNVTTWVGGRIDRLRVNTTGEQVRAGQTVATLYSPEVYGAHQDLITARSQVARLADASATSVRTSQAALDAARERLRLLGVPDGELARMEEAEQPTQGVAIRSPFAGTVIERAATEGAYVETGAVLYRLADLGRLWIQLDAYESDLPRVAVGVPVRIEVDALPGAQFEGRVAFIDPTLDPQRRTARVRVEVDNPDGALRPGMFAEAVVQTGADDGSDAVRPLVVPASAPLFTGKRSVVYVEVLSEGSVSYEPRTVRLGPRMGDVYPVVAGVSEGEHVVTRGAFALDADLQIRGGPSMMTRPDDQDADRPVPLTPEQQAQLAPVVSAYLDVQRALAEDDHGAATRAGEALLSAVAAVALTDEAEEPWAALATELRMHGQRTAQSSDIEGARAAFEPLSAGIQGVLRTFGNPLDTELHLAYCPMAHDNRGASWVQEGEAIDNAYFGAAMRTCGEVRTGVAPGGFLGPAR
jgi:Cu(I)/Ag(I) efflux system membrane fusion protein